MTKQDEAKLIEARKKHPGAGRRILAQVTGLSEKTVRRWIQKNGSGARPGGKSGAVTLEAYKNQPGKKGKTLADFRHTYDKSTIVPAKVKAALKELGVTGWEYESQFHKLAGVSLMDLAMFRELFADYIVNLKDNKRAWAGSTKTANIMREML